MTIGQQLERIYSARLNALGEALNETASEITSQMKDNTEAGKAFSGGSSDLYDDQYAPKYKKWRERNGLQTSRVTLRGKSRRIERTTQPASFKMGDSVGTEVGFIDGGRIFKFHQDGINYKRIGRRIRSIFPQYWSSVPRDIYERMVHNIVGALRG